MLYLTAAVLFLLLSGLRADAFEPSSLYYLTHTWNADAGLPDSSVRAIAQTPDGYLWVGTQHGGLARFDGVLFQTFDLHNTPALSSDEVWNLFVDANGILWINTVNGGITIWRNGVFTQIRREAEAPVHWLYSLVATRADGAIFQTKNGWGLQVTFIPGGAASCATIAPPDGVSSGWFCVDVDGRLWCRTADGGLARLDGGIWRRLTGDLGLKSNTIGIVLSDTDKRIWVGTEKEIAVWDGSRFQNQTPTNGERELTVNEMTFAHDGSLWVGANGRLRRCRDRQWLAEAQNWDGRFSPSPQSPNIYGDDQGGVWITHHGEGVFHATRNGQSIHLGITNGLPNALVDCWLQDRERNVWLGLLRGGLVRLRPGVFHVMDASAAGVDNYATSVCADEEDTWMGTATGGLAHWHDGVAVVPKATMRNALEASSDLVVSPGNKAQIWVGGVGNGAQILAAGELTRPFPAEAVSNVVRAFYHDRHGAEWIGNEFGLFYWKDPTLWRCAEAGLDQCYVLAITEDAAGRLLVGTGEGDLRRRSGEHWEVFRPGDGLPPSRFWALLGDTDGGVWIGTLGGGLLHFEAGKFYRFTTKQGLPSDTVSQVLDDGRGMLWLGTRVGIVRVAKAELLAVASGAHTRANFVVYGRDDGLPTVECSGGAQPNAWHADDDRLWFTTAKGVVSVKPDTVPVNLLTPPVIIESLLVDGIVQELPHAGKADKSLAIPPGRHYFEFHFTGLSFTSSDKVRFRWRLDGLEKNWVDGGNTRRVSYSFLQPGNYSFRVLACNNDGIWNETGAAFNFTVQPFFWQRWWFKIGAPLLGFGLLGGVFYWNLRRRQRLELQRLEHKRALAMQRLAHQQSLERERARIAQDLHDDLGASLTHIAWLGESAGRDKAPATEQRSLMTQITTSSRDMVRAIDEIVWAVNPKNDSLEHLVSYICEYAEQFFRNMPTRCRVDVQDVLPAYPLKSDVRHNLFLAAKEALNNVAKHAEASRVWVRIKVEGGSMLFVIEDDGNGFIPAEKTGGDGLDNMRRRVSAIGAEFELRSTPGRGTAITWKLPLAPVALPAQNHPQG